MYQLKLTEGAARRGALTTVHGTVQTPAFMNVATAAAIKGGISACIATAYRGKGSDLCLPYRWTSYFYGTRGEHADPVAFGFYHCNGI